MSRWTGFYGGFNGGYGWANSSTTTTPFQNFAVAVIPPWAVSQNLNGPVFGGQLGYNYQIANWVVGVEGDFDWAGLNNASQSVLVSPGSGGTATDGFMAHENIQWLASIRGRLGYAWGPSLLYITGGAAWEERNTNLLVNTNTAVAGSAASAASFSTAKSGWVVGAGYEWMITPNWIVRGEYLHYGFNGGDINPVSVLAALRTSCGLRGERFEQQRPHRCCPPRPELQVRLCRCSLQVTSNFEKSPKGLPWLFAFPALQSRRCDCSRPLMCNVQVFGRRQRRSNHALCRPAAENRQGTNRGR